MDVHVQPQLGGLGKHFLADPTNRFSFFIYLKDFLGFVDLGSFLFRVLSLRVLAGACCGTVRGGGIWRSAFEALYASLSQGTVCFCYVRNVELWGWLALSWCAVQSWHILDIHGDVLWDGFSLDCMGVGEAKLAR